MTPTIVEKDGNLFIVVGTPGGFKITTSVFQVITNVIEFDLPLLEAVHQPRFHFQWMPNVLWHEEEAFSPQLIQSLQSLGRQTQIRPAIVQVGAILLWDNGGLRA